MFRKSLPLFIGIFLLAGCAGKTAFDTKEVTLSLTPQSVIAEPDVSRGKIALWGGTILDIHNLKDSTQIEILGYPLDSSQRPLLDSKPLGRFIISNQDYLEPATFKQGRLLSVMGVVVESQSGFIGESSYTYPVINAQKLHLWSASENRMNTSFRFGLGISL